MTPIFIIVATFALCFGVDYLFTKKFRSKTQHRSGLSVRLSKHYAVIGVLLMVLGIAALISGVLNTPVLVARLRVKYVLMRFHRILKKVVVNQ